MVQHHHPAALIRRKGNELPTDAPVSSGDQDLHGRHSPCLTRRPAGQMGRAFDLRVQCRSGDHLIALNSIGPRWLQPSVDG